MISTAEQIVMEVISGGKPKARLMRAGDIIPESFEIGFDKLGQLDYDWIWVVERYGKIEACLVAGPCHGIAFIYRLAMIPGTPAISLLKLMRSAAREAKRRGVRGLILMLDPKQPTQAKLKAMMMKWGGTKLDREHEVVACVLPRRLG